MKLALWSLLVPTVFGTAATWLAYSAVKSEEREAAGNTMQREADLVTETFDRRIKRYEDVLFTARAVVSRAEKTGNDDQWYDLVHGLDLGRRLPGITTVGFVRRVAADDKRAYEAALARRGARGEARSPVVFPAGDRSEYLVVDLVYPSAHAKVLGFDAATEPARLKAMTEAKASGRPTATERVALVSPTSPGAALWIVLPVYGRATALPSSQEVEGYLYEALELEPIVAGINGETTLGSNFEIDVIDASGAILYVAPNRAHRAPASKSVHLTAERGVVVGGRSWTLRYRTTLAVRDPFLPQATLLGGTAVTLLLCALVMLSARARRRLAAVAAAATETIRANEETMADLVRITTSREATFDDTVRALLNLALRRVGFDKASFCSREGEHWSRYASTASEEVSLTPSEQKLLHDVRSTARIQHGRASARHGTPGAVQVAVPSFSGHSLRGVVLLSGSSSELPALPQLEFLVVIAQWVGAELSRREADADLTSARDTALAATRAKSEFLSTVTHEIRSPMNAIIGGADLLAGTKVSAEQFRYVRLLRAAGEQLLGVVNDVLDVSKIEAGQLELEAVPFKVWDLLARVSEIIGVRSRVQELEVDIDVGLDVPLVVVGDAHRLGQVLLNLIGNAVKFTRQGSVTLTIRVVAETAHSSTLSFSVVDTGIGIPEERLGDIFEPYAQVDASTTRKFGGTGLGLTISRSIVAAMGGELRARSRLGEGSRFSFEVELPRRNPLPSIPAVVNPCRALLATERVAVSMIVTTALKASGVDTVTCRASEVAARLEEARQSQVPFVVALADVPFGERGPAALAELITVAAGSGLGVIALGSGSSACSAVVAKPLLTSEIVDSVLRHCQRDSQSVVLTAAAIPRPRAGARVLVAEDVSENALVLSLHLRATGLVLEFAGNGAVAADMAARSAYDLILMDIQMPILDGIGAARSIRANELEAGKKRVPMVALTANGFAEARARALDAGCDHFLTKPVRAADLLRLLAELLPETESAPPTSAAASTAASAASAAAIAALVPAYLANRRLDLERLRDGVRRADSDAVGALAHTIRGSGGSFGFPELSRLAGEIEEHARAGKLAPMALATELLADYLQQLQEPRSGDEAPLRASVKNGRLAVHAPTALPEGTEIELLPVGDDADPKERAAAAERD